MVRDARLLAGRLGPDDQVVLLGSIATGKYLRPLLEALDGRLYYPRTFAGRGDMSRGALMLRCTRRGRQLAYVPIAAYRVRVRRGGRSAAEAQRTRRKEEG